MSSNFAIVNMKEGMRRDLKPFLISNDSFPDLQNAYLFRGRIQRRSCFSKVGTGQSRLRYSLGTTNVPPAIFTNFTLINIPLTSGISQFSVDDVFLTDSGTAANPTTLLSTNALYVGTLDRTTGALTITHPSMIATPVYYYPGLPVMGLRVREQDALNDEVLIAFDTEFSYIFDVGTADFKGANTYKTTQNVFFWSGQNYDLFWTYNYYQVMWATNNNPGINGYDVTAGTNAVNCTFTAPAGHNIAIDDVIQIMVTSPVTTITGFTFLVTNVAGNDITINNPVAPGSVWSGTIIQINKRTLNISGSHLGDGIKWFDGPGSGTGWANFIPPLTGQSADVPNPPYLRGALMLLPYKDRLVALSTWEANGIDAAVNYKQRARWCQDGTPFYTQNNNTPAKSRTSYLLPANTTAQQDSWFSGGNDIGKGGFIDAPTGEAIVAAEFIKDTLIVYFERSTWQLVYTGNQVLPFVWQRINTELGSESTFSIVPFDRGVFGVGNYGIITCDSVNVTRIDQKIPDEVFKFQNQNNGVKRVVGIRDYNSQLVYWTYPLRQLQDGLTQTYALTFPNQILLYNYLDGSWAQFDDSFTCFGYWQSFADKTWADYDNDKPPEDPQDAWKNLDFTWNSQVIQAKYPDVVAGNQRGFVFVFSQLQNLGQNEPSLEISNFNDPDLNPEDIVCPDHNLSIGQFITINSATGFTGANGKVFKVAATTQNTFTAQDSTGAFLLGTGYTGGGLITVLPNFTITTKDFNPFYEKGDSVRVNYIDIYMDRTDTGQFTSEFFTNSVDSDPIETDIVSTSPEPANSYSQAQQRIWHRIYSNTFGSFFQNKFTLSDDQMFDLDITTEDVTIHGLIYYVDAAGRLSYDV